MASAGTLYRSNKGKSIELRRYILTEYVETMCLREQKAKRLNGQQIDSAFPATCDTTYSICYKGSAGAAKTVVALRNAHPRLAITIMRTQFAPRVSPEMDSPALDRVRYVD
jgi:hypothetical protein